MKARRIEYKVFQLVDRTDYICLASYWSSYMGNFYCGYNRYILEYVVEEDLEQAELYFMHNICARGRMGLLAADFGARQRIKKDADYIENVEWKEEEQMIGLGIPRFYEKMLADDGFALLSHVCGLIVLKRAEEGRLAWMPSRMVSYIDRAGRSIKKRFQGARRSDAQLMDCIRKAPSVCVTVRTIDPYFRRSFPTQAIDFRKMDGGCPVFCVLETKWRDGEGEESCVRILDPFWEETGAFLY